jgi:RimJ/RimL family protein N-acetyltransferase
MLVGRRIYLRPLEASDGEILAAAIAAEPETFHDNGRVPTSPLAFGHWIERLHGDGLPSEIFFAVCRIADDAFLGCVGVDHVDWINRTAETGISLIPSERGQRQGTEAKFLLLEYCFDHLHFHAVKSHVWEPNTRSAAALQKQGYRLAGRMKWDGLKDGVWRDTLVFDLLRDEYLAARQSWEQQDERP